MEWLYSVLPTESSYNISLVFSLLSCQELQTDPTESFDLKANALDTAQDAHEEPDEVGLFESIFNLFGSSEAQDSLPTQPPYLFNEDNEHETSYLQDHCQLFLHFSSNQSISFVNLALVVASLTSITVIALVWFTSKLFKSKYETEQNVPADHEIPVGVLPEPARLNKANELSEKESNESSSLVAANKSKLAQPLVIDVVRVNTQQHTNIEHHPSLESVFEETVDIFLQELDQNMELNSHLPSERGDSVASTVASSTNDSSSLTFPLHARRGLRQNHQPGNSPLVYNTSQRKFSEISSSYWIYFQKFRRHVSWVYPDINFAHVNFEELSQADSKLASIIQYLHQRCSIRPKQWKAATFVVDYTLFLLEHELRELSLTSGGLLKFTGFEGIGSAANGTLVGPVDRFDVLLGVDLAGWSQLTVLHNKFCEEVPPGHIVIGVKDWCNSKQTRRFSREACIQGLSGFYIMPRQIEKLIEELVKKALKKLNREHKNKTDRLPFRFQMSPNKKFVISLDTKMLQELGIGVSEINVKLVPAVKIFVPQFGILPPLYAVLPWKNCVKYSENLNSASNSFISRIIGEQDHLDLVWEIWTDELQTVVIQNIENYFHLSGVRSYRRECLMILKAVFSKGSGNNLLNKGEIDTVILDTVVSYLLQESPASEWTLGNLSDRFSDAVHFLKSAYQNIWLPKLLVHNPHLVAQIASLETMSCLLMGRQQNMLTDVTNEAAMKVMGYIDQRLQETRLSRCVKPEFSSHMWEYEFFLFG